MPAETMLITVLAGGGAALLAVMAAGLVAWEAAHRDLVRRVQRVVRTGAAGEIEPARRVRGVLLGALARAGEALRGTAAFSERDAADLLRTVQATGLDPRRVVPAVIGAKFLLLVACPLLAYAYAMLAGFTPMGQLTLAVVGMALGTFAPNWGLAWVRRSYLGALRKGLPDALDLLVVCAEAGLGLERALERVAAEIRLSNVAVAVELGTLIQELRLSADRRAVLANLGERTGLEDFQRLGGTLSQTLRYGTPLGQALRVLASEMRNERMMRLEERAMRLPALLVLPLCLFILPCLFLVLAGPAAIQALDNLAAQ